jgi:ribosomal-protein-alanine N-acetyltransferase
VGLRPFRLRDASAWSALRIRNEEWLRPWEARQPSALSWEEQHSQVAFAALLRVLGKEARLGRCLPFALLYDGTLAGQVTVSPILRGGTQSGSVGYWIDSRLAGRGLMPTALAMVVDHCFQVAGLHRVEANVRPDNTASLRVLEKLGFRREGLQERLLLIDGTWRDHLSLAVTAEEQPEGVLKRWKSLATQGE